MAKAVSIDLRLDRHSLAGQFVKMCNLYRMTKSHAEVARLFSVSGATQANFAEEVYPGYSGAVIAGGAVRSMVWGFPLSLKSKRTGKPLKPKPVNNARSDKLDGYMWRYSFEERRCVIPVTAWAEAEGPKGQMTRTWLSLPETSLFAVAGIWRDSDEWGECYSMVMTDSAGPAADVHSRMPVVLSRSDHQKWTDGTPSEAKDLCRPWEGDLRIDRTDQRWAR